MNEHMIVIDREAQESLQNQIRRQIVIGILNRRYPLCLPLPSVRQLSAELEVSVTPVLLAYSQLKQDGFVVARERSGYFVNQDALTDPGHPLKLRAPDDIAPPNRIDFRAFFEQRSLNLDWIVRPADCLVRYRYPFVCGLSDPSLVPLTNWRECVRDSVNVLQVRTWATDYSAVDDELLVEQLTQRVLAKRGIVADPDEVLVTMDGEQAVYLAIKLLLSARETLGVEDPGYSGVINMARIEGIDVQRFPVDGNGLVLSRDLSRCKCLFVTPSHQFPTAVTMPLARKRSLLQLTRKNGQFVIEYDYEADISFKRKPAPALKGLDRWGNVIYAGGLSKSLLLGLRMGYLVADRDFIREARALRRHMFGHPSVNNQKSVALFLQRGYFDQYIAKLTGSYKRRCDVMHEAIERHFPDAAAKPEFGGTSVWLRLPEGADARILRELVEPEGVFFELGGFTFSDERNNRIHLRLGYSAISRSLIPEGIDKLAKAVTAATPAALRRSLSCAEKPAMHERWNRTNNGDK